MNEHLSKGMDVPVLRDESEALYVSKLPNLAVNVEAGRYLMDWLGYCLLPWYWHTLPFLEGMKM